MATAKEFSFALLKAGFHAKMSKFDLKDAYKIMPTHPSIWRLHGFSWLGKFFVDVTSVFGSKAAPLHFDDLGETLVNIAVTQSRIPRSCVLRTLDDTPVVAPANTNWCEKFSSQYLKLCKFLNIQMAQFDEEREKSFINVTQGTVLGVRFDTDSTPIR